MKNRFHEFTVRNAHTEMINVYMYIYSREIRKALNQIENESCCTSNV